MLAKFNNCFKDCLGMSENGTTCPEMLVGPRILKVVSRTRMSRADSRVALDYNSRNLNDAKM